MYWHSITSIILYVTIYKLQFTSKTSLVFFSYTGRVHVTKDKRLFVVLDIENFWILYAHTIDVGTPIPKTCSIFYANYNYYCEPSAFYTIISQWKRYCVQRIQRSNIIELSIFESTWTTESVWIAKTRCSKCLSRIPAGITLVMGREPFPSYFPGLENIVEGAGISP